MKDMIAKWFEQGLWTETMVGNAVVKGVITEEEYLEIVKKTVDNFDDMC